MAASFRKRNGQGGHRLYQNGPPWMETVQHRVVSKRLPNARSPRFSSTARASAEKFVVA
jgi:hypothetical protein